MEIDSQWLSRHEDGWKLFFRDCPVADLEYIDSRQPVHIFEVSPLVAEKELKKILKELSDHSREEDPHCYLINKKGNYKIKDLDFLLTWNETKRSPTLPPKGFYLKDLSIPEFIEVTKKKSNSILDKILDFLKG